MIGVNQTIPRLALTAGILVLTLLMLGAFLRHNQVGSGCSVWPSCYGQIGAGTTPKALDVRSQPRWATRAHRTIAGLIAVLVIGLAVFSVARRQRGAALALPLLAMVNLLFLVALGIGAGGSRSPDVTVGNLLGGISLLGLLWWLYLTSRSPDTPPAESPSTRPIWIGVGLTLVATEIVLGAIASANYSALACAGFPDCNGQWWPSAALGEALNLFRTLPTDGSGMVFSGADQVAIQLTHRIGALVVMAWGVVFVWQLIAAGQRPRGWEVVLLLLLLFQFGLGMGTAVTPSTLAIALGHNIGAPLLLIAMLGTLHHHLAARAPTRF